MGSITRTAAVHRHVFSASSLLLALLVSACIGSAGHDGKAEASPSYLLDQPIEAAVVTCQGNATLGSCHMAVERPTLAARLPQAVRLPGDPVAEAAALQRALERSDDARR